MKPTLTAFQGLLARTPEAWRWIDGTPEPRVHDLSASKAFQLPRVTYPDPSVSEGRARWVQIPSKLLREEPTLGEVIARAGDSARRCEHSPSLLELPEAVWDSWAEEHIVGLIWDAEDEDGLLTRAAELRARASSRA